MARGRALTLAAPVLNLLYSGSDADPATVLAFGGTLGVTHAFAGTAGDSFPASGVTIAAWVNTTQSDANAVILSFGPTAGGNAGRLWLTNPAALTVHYGTATGGVAATTLAVNGGTWRHVVVGVTPADRLHYAVEIWIDGIQRWRSAGALAFTAGAGLSTSGTFTLGLGQGAPETGLIGQVSELQLWDAAAMPPSQAAALMRHRATDGETGLALVWPLNVAPSGNTIPPAAFVPSTLRFRQPDAGQTTFGSAQWAAIPNAVSYDLQVVAQDGSWTYAQSVTGSGAILAPIAGVMPGRGYQARVRAVGSGETGPWSATASCTPIDLPSASMGFSWPQGGTLSAQWPAVDQAQGYGVVLTTASTPASSFQTGTSLDLSSQVTGDSVVTVAARGATATAAGGSGASGPSSTPGSTTKTALGFYYQDPDGAGNGDFVFDWTPDSPAPAYYYMEVRQGSTVVLTNSVAGSTIPPILVPAPNPVTTGQQFVGRMRRIGQGALAAWDSQTVTIHGQTAPSALYQSATPPAAEALALTWGAVAAGATYNLETRTDGGTTPVVTTGVTSPYSLMSLLSPTSDPTANHSYTFRLRAVIDGDVGPASAVTAAPSLTSAFRYVWNGGQDVGALTVGWTPTTGSSQAYARVFTGPATTPANFGLVPVSQGSFAVTPPNGGFVLGTTYASQLRGLGTGSMSAAQFGQVIIHQMSTPVVQLAQTQPGVVAVEARWVAVDPALTPSYLPVLNGVEGTLQTTRSIDLTSHLNDTAALTVQVRAEADQSYGPLSAVGAPPALQPNFTYLLTANGTQSLTATWTAAPLVYLSVQLTGGGAPNQQLFSDGTTATYAVPAPGGGFVENAVYTLSIKSAANGVLGAMTALPVTIHQLAQPAPVFQSGATADPVTLQWPDVRTQAQITAGLAVTYEIAQNGTLAPNQPSGLVYTLTAAQLATAGVQTFTVQPHAQGSWGVISAPPPLVAPAPTTLTYDAAIQQLALTWPQSPGATGYYADVTTGGGAPSVKQWVAQPGGSTPAAATFSASGLSTGTSYTVRARALAGGAMTDFGALSLTLQQLVGPSSLTLAGAFQQRQITATWQFDASGLGTVTYVAELRNSGGTVLDRQTPSAKSATLTYPNTVAQGDTLTVFVRAVSGGNLGLWSSSPIVVGSTLAQVGGVSASFDTANALTVGWSPVSGSNVTYTVKVTPASGGSALYTQSGVSGTSLTQPQSTTKVANNTTYNIQVQANSGSSSGPWSQATAATTNKPNPPDNGGGGGSGTSGDPVLLANGSYVYGNVDIEVAGVVPLRLDVRYNTVTPLPTDSPPGPSGPLGNRWTHAYATNIQSASDGKTVAVWWGDSVVSVYDTPGSVTGTYAKQGQPNGDVLVRLSTMAYQLTRRDQTVYSFDSSGRLLRIVSPAGNGVNLTYADSRLDRVTDEGSGRYLRFTYFTSGAATGRIKTVADNAGRSISYGYTGGDLTLYTDTTGLTRQFTYWPGSLMYTAVDQTGATFITNTYDGQNRVIQQKDAQAVATGQNYFITFAYADQTISGYPYVQTTVTDRMGYVTTYLSEKTTLNTVSEIHNLAGGAVWRVLRTFDGAGNLTSESVYQGPPGAAAGVGATTTYTYDGARNLLSITNPLGQTQRFTYDGRNNLLTASDALGNTTTVTYVTGTNLPRSVTDPTGGKRIIVYRSAGTIQGLVDSQTDYPLGDGPGAVGNVTTYQYTPAGEVQQITDPLGGATVLGYGTALGRLTSLQFKDPAGVLAATIKNEYWAGVDRVHTSALTYPNQPDAQAYVTTTVFDGVGMLTSVTDPLQRTTGYQYDANSQLEQITYPAASNPDVTQLVRNRNDELIQQVLSASNPTVQTGYGYDEIGRLTSTTDGNGKVTTFAWAMALQAAGTPSPMTVTITQPTVTVTTPGQAPVNVAYQQVLTFDPLGRLISWTAPAPARGAVGAATTIAYTSVAGAGGLTNQQVVTTYPKADQSQPAPYQTTDVFDPLGRVLSHTDERGKVWTTVYGGVIDPVSNTTQRTTTATDPVGNQTIETFDVLDRPIGIKVGKGSSWRAKTVGYDALGRPVRIEEPNPAPNPPTATVKTTVAYAYDPVTRCVRVTVSPYQTAPTVLIVDGAGQWVGGADAHGVATSMTYTPRGQLQTYVNGRQQTLTYGYDPAGRYVTTAPPEAAALVEQVLDGAGNRLQTKVGGAVQITRTFDALNRMLTRTNNVHNETVSYSYAPTGDIATILYPGLTNALTYGYDPMRRLRTVTDWAGRQTSYVYAPNGVLASATLPNSVGLTFTQNDAGQFTGYQATIGQDLLAQGTYTLNAFGEPSQIAELTPLAAAVTAGQTTFSYADPAADRLTAVNGTAVTYDGDGNMTSVPGVAGTLGHNIYNQLVQAGSVVYAFDADGFLDTSTNGAATRRFVHDPAGYANPMIARPTDGQDPIYTLLAQLMGGGAASLPERQALIRPWASDAAMDRPLATVDSGGGTTRYVNGAGLIGRETADGSFQTYVFNGVGSTLALVGAAGVTDAYAYDPYGLPAGRQGVSDNPFALHGRWGVITDPSGLCFMRARTYAPGLARFIEKDPIFGDVLRPQTLNAYGFEPGNPLQFLDPLGLGGGKDDSGGGGLGGGAIAGIVIVVGAVVIGGVAAAAVAAVYAAPAAAAAGAGGTIPASAIAGGFTQRAAFYTGRAVFRFGGRARGLRLKMWASNRAETLGRATSVEMRVLSSGGGVS